MSNCSLCGNDESVARLAKLLGKRPDVAYAKLYKAEVAFKELWNKSIDYLPREAIIDIRRNNEEIFKLFNIS